MGWGRMLLLGNVGQQLDIGDLESAVGGMRDSIQRNDDVNERQEQSIEQLKQENRELKLYLATTIHLLVSKGVLSSDEVASIVEAVEKK